MENSDIAINEIKEIFNKGLQSGIYDITDATRFINSMKYIEDELHYNKSKNDIENQNDHEYTFNKNINDYNKDWKYLHKDDSNV